MTPVRVILGALVLLVAACGDSGETTTTTVVADDGSTSTADVIAATTTASGGTGATTATSGASASTTAAAGAATTTTDRPTTSTTGTAAPTTTAAATTTTVEPAAATTTTRAAATTTTAAGVTTTLPPDAPAEELIVLRGDGLGVADFGDDAEMVVATISELLGPPIIDDGWEDALDNACGGTVVRFPQWDGIFVILTDTATEYAAAGTRHFGFWGTFDDVLSTPSGLSPFASKVSDLLDITDGQVDPVYDDLFDIYFIDVASGAEAGIQFEVEDPEDPEDPILGMSAGDRRICGE